METIRFKDIDITNLVTALSFQEEISNEYILGNAIATQVNITIDNTDGLIKDILDYPFSINGKLYMAYEKPEKWTKTLNLVLYDSMLKFSMYYESNLVYPVKITEQLLEIQSITGVEIYFNDITSRVLEKEVNWYDSSKTIRDYIGYIAECDGKNAYIGKDNKLHFKQLASTLVGLDYCNNYEISEMIEFSCVLWNDKVTEPLSKGIDDKSTLLLNPDNLNISEEDVDHIYELYKGLQFYSFETFKTWGNNISVSDIFTYSSKKFIAFSVKRTVNGGEASDSMEITGEYKSKDSQSVVSDSNNSIKIKKVQAKLDENENKVNITATLAEENKKSISNLEIGIESIKNEVARSTESLYKFESGTNNIFSNCHQSLKKGSDNKKIVYANDMPLYVSVSELKGKDICISVDINVVNGIPGELASRIGVSFDIGYVDGTKKTYDVYWHLGQYNLQYVLQSSTADHSERIWAHFKTEDKDISSVSNLKMVIDLNAENATVANPKVEFGTKPTGFDFDLDYVRDNITIIENNYTQIAQTVDTISLKAESNTKEITTIKGNITEVTTRLQNAEIKLEPTNILLAVNEQIGAGGTLHTTKFSLDKDGGHFSGGGIDIKNNNGDKVFYADTKGNLVINNLTAVNGTFSGTIKGSSIVGSSIGFYDNDTAPYISLDSTGLVIDSTKASAPLVSYDRGKLELSTDWGYFANCTSPIKYTSSDGSERFAIFGTNIAYINLNWSVMGETYLEIRGFGGTYKIKCST